MVHDARSWLLVALALVALAATPYRSGTFTIDVPAGKWKTVRLRDVPQGVLVSVDVKSNGRLEVVVVDARDFRRFPRFERPLFRGEATGRLTFSVTTRDAGNHFVVIFNRSEREARTATVTVSATRTPETVPPQGEPRGLVPLGTFRG